MCVCFSETFSASGTSTGTTLADGEVSSSFAGNSSHRSMPAEGGNAAKLWCNSIWDGISCWPLTPPGSIVAKSCHLLLRAIDDTIPPDTSYAPDSVTQAAQLDETQHHLSQHYNSGLTGMCVVLPVTRLTEMSFFSFLLDVC